MEQNNNFYEEKKGNNNKILIGVIVVLVLGLLGLTYYTFFMRDNKVDNTDKPIIEDNKNHETTINYEVKTEKTEAFTIRSLYINGIDTNVKSAEKDFNIEKFNDLLIVTSFNPGPSITTNVFNKEGKNVKTLSSNSTDDATKLSISCTFDKTVDKDVYVNCTKYNQGDIYFFCDLDSNEIISYTVKYEYLGKEQFSEGITINTEKVSDHKFNYKCEDRNTINHGKVYN